MRGDLGRRARRHRQDRHRGCHTSTSPSTCPPPSPCCRCAWPVSRRRPPPKPGAVIRLDLQLDTPGQIFVRGRGLDAVLGGSLHVAGTTRRAPGQRRVHHAPRHVQPGRHHAHLFPRHGGLRRGGGHQQDRPVARFPRPTRRPPAARRPSSWAATPTRPRSHLASSPRVAAGRGARPVAVRPQRLPARPVPIRRDRRRPGRAVRQRQRPQSAGPGAQGLGPGPAVDRRSEQRPTDRARAAPRSRPASISPTASTSAQNRARPARRPRRRCRSTSTRA